MHACSLDEDAKIGRLHHRLVAEGRAVGVRGVRFVLIMVGELPHPLRKVPGACVCVRKTRSARAMGERPGEVSGSSRSRVGEAI